MKADEIPHSMGTRKPVVYLEGLRVEEPVVQITVQVQRLENQKCQGQELICQIKYQAERIKLLSPLCSAQTLNELDGDCLHQEIICFTLFTSSNVNLFWKHSQTYPKVMCNSLSGHPIV
jgi:hypothetical protein